MNFPKSVRDSQHSNPGKVINARKSNVKTPSCVCVFVLYVCLGQLVINVIEPGVL